MGAAGPKEEIKKAEGWEIPGALTKHVVLDPGIAYTTADVLMFAGTNPVGLGAMLTATGIAATLKTAAVLQPTWLDKHPRFKQFVFDDRTPLRAGGLALFVVAGATIATGAWLPAAASFLFGIANIRLAQSLSRQGNDKKDAPPEAPKKGLARAGQIVKTLFTRPELYLNTGFALAGLMAGGAALFILPVVAVAFAIGFRNAIQNRPEHEGHPKLITASAAGVFTGIGHANGHGLIAGAHLLNTIVLAEMERRITPGGAKQIVKNIMSLPKKLLGFGKDQPAVVAEQKPVAVPVVTAAPLPLTASNSNVHIPAPEVKPADLDKVDLQQVFALKAKITPPTPANENQQPAAEAIQPPEHGNRPPKIANP